MSMKYVQEIGDHSSLRALVLQDLKDLGIKPPKSKKNKAKDDSVDYGASGVFGTHLIMVPTVTVDCYGPVPKFLADAFRLLEKHINTEGLFRKSGSVARQKELKQRAESGDDFNDVQPMDIASLVKQFFRELPDPLLTSKLHNTFLKCHQVEPEHARVSAILLLCHLLPWEHLSTLRFTMCFLRRIANKSEVNKMDVPNLAICLSPNLLHTNSRNDKMNSNESKLLQIQTSIVQYLITNAECIGMVSASLYERTTLMVSCFASEDELEKSDAGNDSKAGKKKKKRSGSLQGLVSNLSNSFSKWRRDSKGHNQSNLSDRSTMSMMSVDKSTLGRMGDAVDGFYYEYDVLSADATPKMIRKRKAEDEGVPFSASKKKAILQNMPQMSTLGNTPFKTPATIRKGRPQDFMNTPNMKFAENGEVVFNATPRMRIDPMLVSPGSSNKAKRTSSGKSSCFTPKTPKSNVRRKMKGFLRRLSGGKDAQQPMNPASGILNSSDVGVRLSGKDGATIIDPNGQRKRNLLRKHRKTPSSPARLVTGLLPDDHITPDSSCSSLASAVSSNPSIVNLQLESIPRVRSPATSSEISVEAAHTSLNKSSGLRRGKPNTMRSGLPSPAKRRSLDVGSVEDVVLSTVDTSPIQKIDPMLHDEDDADSPVMHCEDDSDEEGYEDEQEESDEEDLECRLGRQVSGTSMHSMAESDHDRAFIHESMLADTTSVEESERGVNTEENVVDSTAFNDGFKQPFVPNAAVKQDHSACSDTSSSSVCTVIYASDRKQPSAKAAAIGCSKSESHLTSAKSMDSIDSAIETDDGKLCKSASLQSIGSIDSGLGGRKDTVSLDSLPILHLSREPYVRHGIEPNLQISADMQNMLQRAGLVEACDDKAANDEVANLSVKEAVQEISVRHRSPLRFTNSPARRRGVSPIRIPTIFARADVEAKKYRSVVPPLRMSPKHGSRKPNLPISTDLVNAVSVQNARTRLTGSPNKDMDFHTPESDPILNLAGHTPMYPLGGMSMSIKDPENIENDAMAAVVATPKIKPMLMTTDVTKRLLAVVPPNQTTPARKHARSPIKPIKRLQGSPKSPNPRRYSSSPSKVVNLSSSGESVLTPMPAHMASSWGV